MCTANINNTMPTELVVAIDRFLDTLKRAAEPMLERICDRLARWMR